MPSSLSCLPVDVELDASNVVGEKLTWRWLVTHRAKRRPIGVEVSRRRLENIEVIRESRDAGDEQSMDCRFAVDAGRDNSCMRPGRVRTVLDPLTGDFQSIPTTGVHFSSCKRGQYVICLSNEHSGR
jgi:hypothetical protein